MRQAVAAAFVAVTAFGATACSPVMAAKQPACKDVDLLSPGVPRNMVLAELGQPVASEIKDGKRVEVFSFVQGYRRGVRIGRTIGHAAADVVTAWLVGSRWHADGSHAERPQRRV